MQQSPQWYEKRSDSEPVYNEKYLKTKVKPNERKIYTDLHGYKVVKQGSQCISLSVIFISSVFRSGKDYFPEVLLEECKYIVKEKTMLKHITDDIKIFSDEENSIKTNSDEG